jgi:hypothetical protein
MFTQCLPAEQFWHSPSPLSIFPRAQSIVGSAVGMGDTDGNDVGIAVGDNVVGVPVGSSDGRRVGRGDGGFDIEGIGVGRRNVVGWGEVGTTDGAGVGFREGMEVVGS